MAKRLNVSLGFDADTSKARRQIQELQTSLDSLIKSSVKTSSSGELALTKQLTEAQVAAGKLQAILSQSIITIKHPLKIKRKILLLLLENG